MVRRQSNNQTKTTQVYRGENSAQRKIASAFAFQLNTYDEETNGLNVIIETPKGSRNKFNYDEEHGIFKLGGVLPAGASFPSTSALCRKLRAATAIL
jgi:hypothetical protein